MIPRYTRPEMGRHFSDATRYANWLRVEIAHLETLEERGIATPGTAEFLASYGYEATVVHMPSEHKTPDAGALLEAKLVDLVINIPKNYQERELTDDYLIRRKAVDYGIPLLTNIQLANRLAEALSRKTMADLHIKELQAY